MDDGRGARSRVNRRGFLALGCCAAGFGAVERPREIIDGLKLPAADRDRIYSDNAARVLGL